MIKKVFTITSLPGSIFAASVWLPVLSGPVNLLADGIGTRTGGSVLYGMAELAGAADGFTGHVPQCTPARVRRHLRWKTPPRMGVHIRVFPGIVLMVWLPAAS